MLFSYETFCVSVVIRKFATNILNINDQNTTAMKRKDYSKPTMQVVKLQHQCHLLQESQQQEEVPTRGAQKQDYIEEEW